MFSDASDRLPKKLLFGQVKGLRPPGRPRSSFNDVALKNIIVDTVFYHNSSVRSIITLL